VPGLSTYYPARSMFRFCFGPGGRGSDRERELWRPETTDGKIEGEELVEDEEEHAPPHKRKKSAQTENTSNRRNCARHGLRRIFLLADTVRQILHHLGLFSSDAALESKILAFSVSHADLLVRLRSSTHKLVENQIRPLDGSERLAILEFTRAMDS